MTNIRDSLSCTKWLCKYYFTRVSLPAAAKKWEQGRTDFVQQKTRLPCWLQWSGYSRRNIRQDDEQMLSSGRSTAHLYKEAVHEEGWTANSQNDTGARFFIATKRVFREIIIAKTLSMRPYKKSLWTVLSHFYPVKYMVKQKHECEQNGNFFLVDSFYTLEQRDAAHAPLCVEKKEQ